MLDLRPLEWRVALVSHMTSGEVSVTDMFQHHRLEEADFLLYDTVHPQCSAVEYQKLVSWGSQDHRCKRNAGKDHLWSPLSSQTAMMVTQAVKLASTLPLGSAAVPH